MVSTELDWESLWAPYDETTYQQALEWVCPTDVVVDIGAGDLRFGRCMAARCRKVYAIERQALLIQQAQREAPLPSNLVCWIGDAREIPFPDDVTVGVLLMRHCRHTGLYMQKLQMLGARGLITNARWHLGVEFVDLQAPRLPFEVVAGGWYACMCGNVGFIPVPLDMVGDESTLTIQEVAYCPACYEAGRRS